MAQPMFDGTTDLDGPAASDNVSLGRQVLRRRLNDRIYAAGDGRTEEIVVFCECGRRTCTDATRHGLRLPRAWYEQVRVRPTQFVVRREHAVAADRVVRSYERFLIVEKLGLDGLDAAIEFASADRRLP